MKSPHPARASLPLRLLAPPTGSRRFATGGRLALRLADTPASALRNQIDRALRMLDARNDDAPVVSLLRPQGRYRRRRLRRTAADPWTGRP